MNSYKDHSPTENRDAPFALNDVTPFETVEDVWFWFIAAQEAKNDGAKFISGAGLYKRPCEPVDILKILDRLYRNRILKREHLLVLRHYGRRKMSPDQFRSREKRAYHLWHEAMQHLEDAFAAKGIIETSHREEGEDFDFTSYITQAIDAQANMSAGSVQ